MDDKKIPFMAKLQMAAMLDSAELCNRTFEEALGEMTERCTTFAQSYDRRDLPFVIASMKIVSGALESILKDDEKDMVKMLLDHTSSVVINASELRKQAKEVQDDAGTETAN